MKKGQKERTIIDKGKKGFGIRNLPIEIRQILKSDKHYARRVFLSQDELVDVLKKVMKKEMNHHKKQDLEDKILETVIEEKIFLLTKNEKENFGQKAADKISSFGGSWRFIICFIIILLFWIVLNSLLLTQRFDPYPFILLNLVLSCLAAIQAPIILMSQNRQTEIDRKQAVFDFKTNLKAEVEIRVLNKKLDRLLEYHQIKMNLDVDSLSLTEDA